MNRSFGLVLLLALLWGSSYPLLKVSVETIPPLTVTAVRSLLGGLLLLAALGPTAARQLWQPGMPKHHFVQGLFNCILPWMLVAWAAQSIDASLAAILNSLSPIFIFLLTWMLTRHEATGRKFAGVALGLTGVVVIIGIDAFRGIGKHTVAEVACVAGALCYAIAAMIGRRFDSVSPLVPAAGATLTSAMVMIPVALVFEQPWNLEPSMRSMVALGGSAVISTGLAFVVYFRLLATVGPIAMSAQAYLRILVGVALGVIFLDEKLPASVLAGLPLVLAGVIFMTMPPRKER